MLVYRWKTHKVNQNMKSRIDKTEYSFFIDKYDNMSWYKNSKYHRDNDLPAIIWNDGTMAWCKNGDYHRDNDKPAIIYNDGRMSWYINGYFIRVSRK